MSGGVGEKFHALGFKIVGAQGAHQIGQPLGAMTEGEPATVANQTGGTGTEILQGATLLTSGSACTGAAVEGEVGRIGDHQIELPGGEWHGAQVGMKDVAC